MNYSDFSKDAAHKKRTVKDLARFISTRTDNNPNYSLLFGAGCSISSGVRSATQLTDLWRKELYLSCAGKSADPAASREIQKTYLKNNEGSWYYPDKEYSSLFEKRYDLQRQRRMFVETEVAGKTPSIGYAYLTALVGQNYFNTIFTTNFDDILNEAFYLYSLQRPIVCAHDSSINSITVTSKRPKIIKIHGDYLFDDLKSTVRETENLEQNMKTKFMEFAKDYGLIVLGYSGGDRSVMDVLSSLLRNDEFLKNGIYWCLRPGSEVSEELRKLIWRDRVYFVEIDGFDELFAELFALFNNGEILPASATSIVYRPSDTANKLLASPTAFPTSSLILKQARERLERQSKRTNLVNLIVRPDSDDKKRSLSSDGLEDDEFALLAEIQNLSSSDSHEQAIELGRNQLRNPISRKLKLRILQLVANSHRSLDQIPQAIGVADELISLQPKKAEHHLLKADMQIRPTDRLKCIEAAISANPYSVSAHLEQARYHVTACQNQYGEERTRLVALAHEELDKGIRLNPLWTNRCWLEKFNLWREKEFDKKKKLYAMGEIVKKLEEQNPLSYRVLSMRVRILEEDYEKDVQNNLLQSISEAKERNSPDLDLAFDRLSLKIVEASGNADKLKSSIESALTNEKAFEDGDYAVEIARILREKYERDDEAIALLQKSLDHDFDVDVLFHLVQALSEMGQHETAELTLTKFAQKLSKETLSGLRIGIEEQRGKIDEALKEVRRFKALTDISYSQNEHYFLLLKGQYKEVEDSLRARLQSVNYTPEATVETVNYEIAKKKQNQKISTDRLLGLAKHHPDDPQVLAAVYAVLGRRNELLIEIKNAMKANRRFRFQARRWPAFDEYRTDPDFKKLIHME